MRKRVMDVNAWQEIKKVVANAAFDAEMGAAYGEVV